MSVWNASSKHPTPFLEAAILPILAVPHILRIYFWFSGWFSLVQVNILPPYGGCLPKTSSGFGLGGLIVRGDGGRWRIIRPLIVGRRALRLLLKTFHRRAGLDQCPIDLEMLIPLWGIAAQYPARQWITAEPPRVAPGLADRSGYACPLTQYHLADALGLTSIHVNRTLRTLREAGLVSMREGRVEIMDLDGLVKLAEFDPTYLDQTGPLLR